VQDAVDIETISGILLTAVDTIEPAHAGLWISST
jgi:hypothetical protein